MLYASSERGPFLGLPRVRRTGEFKVVVGYVVTGTVGSTGRGKVTVRRDMFGTEAENCGVSFGEKGSSLFMVHTHTHTHTQ